MAHVSNLILPRNDRPYKGTMEQSDMEYNLEFMMSLFNIHNKIQKGEEKWTFAEFLGESFEVETLEKLPNDFPCALDHCLVLSAVQVFCKAAQK